MLNKVVLIGVNNYNGLGLVRSFGENGIKPYGIMYGRDKDNRYVEKSKHWEQVWHVNDAEDAVEALIDKFSHEEEKPIVISYTDKVMQLLDERYDELSDSFILPNINGKSNGINQFANKKEQSLLLEKCGYETICTKVLDLGKTEDISENLFPIILKPVQGGEGEKLDIKICNDKETFDSAINLFRGKQYKRVLLQQYIKDRSEYVILGAVDGSSNFISFSILKNIRQYPKNFGVGCFSQYVTKKNDPEVYEFSEGLLKQVVKLGYSGPIDIEVFKDNSGNLYVNEFNWRVSGRNFIALDTKVFSVVWWAKLKRGEKIPNENLINTKEGFTMKETEDIKNVLSKNLKLSIWLKDYKKSTGLAIKNKNDKKPSKVIYKHLLKKLFKRGGGK